MDKRGVMHRVIWVPVAQQLMEACIGLDLLQHDDVSSGLLGVPLEQPNMNQSCWQASEL